MSWDDDAQEEFDRMMGEEYPVIEPGLARACRFEDDIAEIKHRLEIVEGRNPLLESIQQRLKGE